MMSRKSSFELLKRGYDNILLLIPGWATDWRIFENLDLPFDYLVPKRFSPFDFAEELLFAINEACYGRLSVFGWSMGAILASKLAAGHPKMFKEIILVSARPRYDAKAIDDIKQHVNNNRKGFLRRFYNDFFSESEEAIALGFRRGLMRDYISGMNPAILMNGLDYILEARLYPDRLGACDVTFVHGTADRIAPIKEARTICGNLPRSRFIPIEGAGHAPFLRSDFRKILYGASGG